MLLSRNLSCHKRLLVSGTLHKAPISEVLPTEKQMETYLDCLTSGVPDLRKEQEKKERKGEGHKWCGNK